MPLPRFLLLISAVVVAGAASLWIATRAGVPMTALALGLLIAAAVARLAGRVE